MDKNGHPGYRAPMNVALTPELEDLIRRKLASGLYKNASEVVREGLRLLAEEDEWKADVRRKISEGMAQARAGKLVEGDAAVGRLARRIEARRKKAK